MGGNQAESLVADAGCCWCQRGPSTDRGMDMENVHLPPLVEKTW